MAYETLSDEAARFAYDKTIQPIQNVAELFKLKMPGRVVFDAMVPKAPAEQINGMDIVQVVEVDPEFLNSGGNIDFGDVHGHRFDIRVTGTRDLPLVRIRGGGEPGKAGGERGDLLLLLLAR